MRSTLTFALLTLALAGCPDGIQNGNQPDANLPDGADPDGSLSPDGGGPDTGTTPDGRVIPPGAGAPEDLSDCEREHIILLVNDQYVWGYQLIDIGLGDDLAWAIVNRRNGPDRRYGGGDDQPFTDVDDLATVPGMDEAVWGQLRQAVGEGCALPDGQPEFDVLFTDPQCAALPDHDIPAGVRCYGSSREREDSADAAGIVSKVISWIDAARRVKEAHPERDVNIFMAYLSWSNSAVYRSICRATAAGVRFEGYFDRGAAGGQPQRLSADDACNLDNIDVHLLGGITDWPDWRLMHIKLLMVDTGEPTTRLAFSSANLTSTGVSIHFENWVFSRFPSDSHFVASHDCARRALYADRYTEDGSHPNVFQGTLSACLAGLTTEEDPRYRVIFTPDLDAGPMNAAIAAIDAATTRVDMAIQHFSAFSLGGSLRRAAMREGVTARLLLDDDTYYDDGDTGGVDHALYEYLAEEAALDIRFLQTNRFLGTRSWQYQHNKYVVIDDNLVFCGAGNFTVVAFEDNYENFYLLEDAALAATFRDHFESVSGLAKVAAELPAESMY